MSKVTNMGSMFNEAHNFNQYIGRWNVSKVTNMSFMFWDARVFNQRISKWDVHNVTTMEAMFNSCPIKKNNKPFRNQD